MGHKRNARAHQFAERAARYSTRINARGFGFPDSLPEDMSLHGGIHDAIYDSLTAMLAATQVLVDEQDTAERRSAAYYQINRLRGEMGNWASRIGDPAKWSMADCFMSVARKRMDERLFDQLLIETRALRDQAAYPLREEIRKAMAVSSKGLAQASSFIQSLEEKIKGKS